MLREDIVRVLEDAQVEVTGAQLDALTLHAEMMLAENEKRNLTRITEPRAVAVLHVADSLTALPFLTATPDGSFADLGSGAGYPGIPLAVLTGRPVSLVEARSGKAEFLRDAATALRLDAEVVHERAEEAAASRCACFTAVTARALAALPALVELASPLLVQGGLLIALKGDLSEEELERGDKVASQTGMRRARLSEVALPGEDARRTIVVYERTGESQVRLPRRPGMAQRKPLA